MDFWSRLIGGTTRNTKQPPAKNNSRQQRLDRFRRTFDTVKQICSQPQRLGQPGPLIDQLLSGLRQLATLLREELRSPAPYTCLAFASNSQIYSPVGRAASVCKDERVITEAVNIFSILIDSEVEGFTSSRAFARAFMRFSMRVLDAYYVYVSSETESLLVEVLFNIAAKIRLEPEVLSVWFAPSQKAENEEDFLREKKSFAGITKKDDFPLCYLFIDRVHSEGRIGDFARTGLLYIFEAASRAPTLEAWIVASDLPTLMASALGALYSQLSRELSLLQDQNSLPLLLAMSDYLENNQNTGVETVSSASYKAHMATFLSDLTFWQDILDHCRSEDVRQTLLDHFHILFLQQLLYPSLLQSSDTDGGSSVAVMTYLNSILQTLTDEGLSDMLLTYLLGAKQTRPSSSDRPESPVVLRRRSSLMLLAKPVFGEDSLQPSLFNLVDLIHNGIQSHNSQTVFASLKLFTTIMTLQPSHALGSLIRTSPELQPSPDRTIGALHAETSALISIAASVGGVDGMDEAFSGASYDFRKNLEMIALRRAQAGHGIDSRNNSVILDKVDSKVRQTLLDLNDTGLRSILTLVRTFLSNAVETNLAMTETVLTITTSMDVDISELLAIRPDDYVYVGSTEKTIHFGPEWIADEQEEEMASLAAVLKAQQRPVLSEKTTPAIHKALQSVQSQVNSLRQSIARFDALLSKRKAIIQAPQQVDLFSSPVKSARKQKALALTLSRHTSPSPLPRPGSTSHARQLSVTTIGSRNESPARQLSSVSRGRPDPNNPITPTSPTISSPMLLPQGTPSQQIRPQSTVSSPVRSLNANIFRPPPPEPNPTRSPPRMAPLSARASSPAAAATPPRNSSMGPGPDRNTFGSSPSTKPLPSLPPHLSHISEPDRRFTASPGAGAGETDAETLNTRIRFDGDGVVVSIGAAAGGGRGDGGSSGVPSGAQNPGADSVRGQVRGLAGRLRVRGEVVPSSSRGSSVGGVEPGPDNPRRESATDTPAAATADAVTSRSGLRNELGDGAEDERQPRTGEDMSREDGEAGEGEEDVEEDGEEEDQIKDVSLSHVLTNIVVLQNFILELVAVMQQRARIYEGEVSFH